jgi:tetratricopeptide (TPR) repeat protein/transcriptional regulator with XRE-family HTH domain
VVAEVPPAFAGVLRGLRTEAGLTQEELAQAAGLTSRAISYLERGEVSTPRRETVRLLADALKLTGPARTKFEAAARGRAAPGAAGAEEVAATRTLPRDIASFTGRQRELAELAEAAAGSGGVVSIHAIGGMAGIGKTAFAVHAAHRLAGRFPGGQIFVPLHGHTPGHQPADPADALAGLLLTVGVAVARIPAGLEARMILWRDRAAQRQLLLILDDATGSEQVIPLLPGSGGSLVLVTSRRHLSALEDATPISLDTLPPGEAAVLLTRLTGRAGLSPQDPAVGELTRLCGYLPLAIGMVARQLRHHPAWTAAGRAAELAEAADRLEVMATENLSVAAAFDLSYAALTEGQQRLFRRLGLHPGTDIDSYAAAALDGSSLLAARRGLEDLYDHYLLTEPTPGRYRLHDLIREHARALAGRLDPREDRDAAITRLLDYYQHTAGAANALIARQTPPAPAAPDPPIPAATPGLAGPQRALAWARAERPSLLACLDHATATGQHGRVISLTAGLSALLLDDGPWADAITRHIAAAAAAQHLGDRLGQAGALNDLGAAQRLAGDYTAAARAHEQALSIYCDIGNRLGEANALNSLGHAWRATSDYRAAAEAHSRALNICRDIGNGLGQVNALHGLGDVRRLTNDFTAATGALEQAFAIARDIGYQLGAANALTFLGDVLLLTGDYPAAVQALEQALGIYRQIGNRFYEAQALAWLGNALRQTGDYPAAVQALEQALGIARDIGIPITEANCLNVLGAVLRLTGDYPAAVQALEQAVDIYLHIGNQTGRGMALNEKGTLHRITGELALAEECHQQALDIARAIGSSWEEANALAGLGRCALAVGRVVEGDGALRQALAIFRHIGSAEATEVAGELDALSGQEPGRAQV